MINDELGGEGTGPPLSIHRSVDWSTEKHAVLNVMVHHFAACLKVIGLWCHLSDKTVKANIRRNWCLLVEKVDQLFKCRWFHVTYSLLCYPGELPWPYGIILIPRFVICPETWKAATSLKQNRLRNVSFTEIRTNMLTANSLSFDFSFGSSACKNCSL